LFNLQDQTINQITATLAHEVKNPIALIKANIQYIQMNDKDHLYDKNYKVIEKELKKISQIISDFISISQSNYQENTETIFICDLINDIVEDYDISINEKDINFITQCSNKDLSFKGEYSKINILLFNIYKNAVEAIKQKGTIKTQILKNDKYIQINIIDDGEGISENSKEFIGKPFFTTKEDGSGLGISICKSIAKENGGSFELINNNGRGCTAIVKLPIN